jgi:outer membrane receptor protein involved in Fe transport
MMILMKADSGGRELLLAPLRCSAWAQPAPGGAVPGTTPQGNEFCWFVEFGAGTPAPILRVSNPRLNLNKLETSGIDFEIAYNVPSLFDLPGKLGVQSGPQLNARPVQRQPVSYVSLSGQYKVIEGSDMNVTLYGVVNNLTDQDPPEGTGVNAIGPPLYDLVGRTFRAVARVSF